MSETRKELLTKLADIQREIDAHDFLGASRALLEKEKATLERTLMELNNDYITRLESVMGEFVRRVEAGEVRSKKTYADFKAALGL